jgi:hypothetical protein
MVILLMDISDYFISDYSINGYRRLFCYWLLLTILLMAIGCYSINEYWWLFYCGYWCSLMAIILVVIGGY